MSVRLIIAAGVVLALAVIATAQTWWLSRWQDRAATAQAQVAGYAEAARIRAESDRRQLALRVAAARLDHDLSMREGADAPLSEYLRDSADRVWP